MSRWLSLRWPLDRAIAVLLQVILAPVLAVAGAMVRLDDGRPSVIAVPRVGRAAQPFGMRKVRTMSVASAGGLSSGPSLAGPADGRVTVSGRRLRRWRLDELPQLRNVAAGEMALIGPRPEAPDYVDARSQAWQVVLQARPGIAGPTQIMVLDWEAQVLGGPSGERDYREVILPVKLAIDRWYVANASPWIDALVVAASARRMIGGRREARLAALIRRAVPEAGAIPRAASGAPTARKA